MWHAEVHNDHGATCTQLVGARINKKDTLCQITWISSLISDYCFWSQKCRQTSIVFAHTPLLPACPSLDEVTCRTFKGLMSHPHFIFLFFHLLRARCWDIQKQLYILGRLNGDYDYPGKFSENTLSLYLRLILSQRQPTSIRKTKTINKKQQTLEEKKSNSRVTTLLVSNDQFSTTNFGKTKNISWKLKERKK